MSSAPSPPISPAEAPPAPPFDGRTRDSDAPESLAARLEWLLIPTALAAVVLIYPLRLQQDIWTDWMAFLSRHAGAPVAWAVEQLNPLLMFMFSPLILKGVIAGVAMIAFVMLRAARGLTAPVSGRPLGPHPAQPRRAWLAWACFFAWVAASAWWAPASMRPLALDGAGWALLYGIFGWVLLRRGLSDGELRRLAVTFVLLGLPVLILVFGEALPLTQPSVFLYFYKFDDPRNVFGSLIGHNTGAASLLMMTAFPALALALTARTHLGRALPAVYLAFLLPGVIVLQSRSIWVLGALLGVLAARSMLRITMPARRGWIPTLLLAAVAAGLASQAINSPWNPFFIANNPLAHRLEDLTPERLGQESRLRLNYLGVRLIPDRPFIGHGLYTFQYLYPRLQGEYFWEHPDSKLGQTEARSHMAHNEYLQVAIEQGLIGLALMAWMLAEIARRGWRRRHDLGGRPRLIHEAFGWSALGFACHAAFDFPFHIPQLALPGLVCLAAWGACVAHDEYSTIHAAPVSGAPPSPVPNSAAPTQAFHFSRFARLLAAMACIAAIPFLALPFARALQADYFYNQASSFLDSLNVGGSLSARQQADRLLASIQLYNDALKLTPSHGLAWHRLADAYRRLADLEGAQKDSAGHPIAANRAQAIATLNKSLAALDRAAGLIDFDLIYYYRAQDDFDLARFTAWQGLDEASRRLDASTSATAVTPPAPLRKDLENAKALIQRDTQLVESTGEIPDFSALLAGIPQLEAARALLNKSTQYDRDYRRNMTIAIHYTPTRVDAVKQLAEHLMGDPSPDAQQITALRKLIYHYNPHYFQNEYFRRGSRLLDEQQYELAAQAWDQLLLVDDRNPQILISAALAHFYLGDDANALRLLLALRAVDPSAHLANESGLMEAVLQQHWADALEELAHMWSDVPSRQARFSAIEIAIKQRLGRPLQPLWFKPPAGVAPAEWDRLLAEERPAVLFHFMRDPAAARQAVEARLAMPGPPPPITFWIDATRLGIAGGDAAFAARMLDGARKADPGHPALGGLAAQIARLPAGKG